MIKTGRNRASDCHSRKTSANENNEESTSKLYRSPRPSVSFSLQSIARMAGTIAHFVLLLLFLASSPSLAQRLPETAPTLATVQRRAFDFFWNETNRETGLTRDRARNQATPDSGGLPVASISATGYMLAALPIAVEHGWVTKSQAYERGRAALRCIHDTLPNVHGFYYHFLDARTGARVWNCELSSIDSALLALGALAAGEYWPHTEVQRLAGEIAGRMDWRWMRTNGGAMPEEPAPSMGWNPEKGFLASRWMGYNEAVLLYLLGLGTPGSAALPRDSWDRRTFPTVTEEGYPVFGGPSPLFMAQMGPGYFDLRGLRDRQGRDWWTAWKNAHLADQAYCARHPLNKTYAAGYWAINASDQPDGYGADSPQDGRNTGTVSPTAMVAAIVFTPERSRKSLADLWTLRERIWGRYGFCDAFNLGRNWFDTDVIGIDLGMMLLLTENARSGLIWRLIKRSSFARRGLEAAGFHQRPSPEPPSVRFTLSRSHPLTRSRRSARAARDAGTIREPIHHPAPSITVWNSHKSWKQTVRRSRSSQHVHHSHLVPTRRQSSRSFSMRTTPSFPPERPSAGTPESTNGRQASQYLASRLSPFSSRSSSSGSYAITGTARSSGALNSPCLRRSTLSSYWLPR